MADLGSQKISSNYQKLLQTADGGIVQDGSGSAIPNLNITGNISASGTISASIIYADTMYTSGSSLYIGSEKFTQSHITYLKAGKSLKPIALGQKNPTIVGGLISGSSISASGFSSNHHITLKEHNKTLVKTYSDNLQGIIDLYNNTTHTTRIHANGTSIIGGGGLNS